MPPTNLFDDFPRISAKAWKQKIQVDLKGADYNEALVWVSAEGIKVKPFYTSEDPINTSEVYSGNSWKGAQELYCEEAQSANKKALEILDQGIESLVLKIASPEVTPATLFQNIDLEKVSVFLEPQFLSSAYLSSLSKYAGDHLPHVKINTDIIGNLASSGNWFRDMDADFKVLANYFTHSLATFEGSKFWVDGSIYQNAGANTVQQLAYMLAHANEYLHYFDKELETRQGQTLSVCFKVAIGSNYFFEIAKLRALRILWEALGNLYNTPISCDILAVPSKRNKTVCDFNNNMLRTTMECMAAVIGGANTVCNLRYDALYNNTNDFAERIARNQLLILKNESYFDRVLNPATGAYYIESLTSQLAQKALDLFKSIEQGGGFLKQLKEHTIQKKIRQSAQNEQAAFNQGKEVLIGINKYEDLSKDAAPSLQKDPFKKRKPEKTLIEPLPLRRLAADHEHSRLEDG